MRDFALLFQVNPSHSLNKIMILLGQLNLPMLIGWSICCQQNEATPMILGFALQFSYSILPKQKPIQCQKFATEQNPKQCQINHPLPLTRECGMRFLNSQQKATNKASVLKIRKIGMTNTGMFLSVNPANDLDWALSIVGHVRIHQNDIRFSSQIH